MSTDAIANAGGTTIKYVDTQTTVDVSGYGNILGAYITDAVGNVAIGLVPYRSRTEVLAFVAVYLNQTVTLATGRINIRVFYY